MKQYKSYSMIQTVPLPGSFRHKNESFSSVLQKALDETGVLSEAGFDGAMLQNMGDKPIKDVSRPEAIAYISVIAHEIKKQFPSFELGILINWDGVASVAAADASGADFVRVEHLYAGAAVTPAGIIEGQCIEVCDIRKRLCFSKPVYVDVLERHLAPLVRQEFEDDVSFAISAYADGLFLGGRTLEDSIQYAKRSRSLYPNIPLFVGFGVKASNTYELLKYYDGICIARWIKHGDHSNPIDKKRAKDICREVTRAKEDKVDFRIN